MVSYMTELNPECFPHPRAVAYVPDRSWVVCPHEMKTLDLWVTLLWLENHWQEELRFMQRYARIHEILNQPPTLSAMPAHVKSSALAPWLRLKGQLGWIIPRVYERIASRHMARLEEGASIYFAGVAEKVFNNRRLPKKVENVFLPSTFLFDGLRVWADLVEHCNPELASLLLTQRVMTDPVAALTHANQIADEIDNLCRSIATGFDGGESRKAIFVQTLE